MAKREIDDPVAVKCVWTRFLNVFCKSAIHSGQNSDTFPDNLDFYRHEVNVPESCLGTYGEHSVVVKDVREFKVRVDKGARKKELKGNL